MNEATDSASNRSGQLQALIGAYLDDVQSGRSVDRDAWLLAHPDVADDLRAFLADYDQFQELAAPLRDVAGAAATVARGGTSFSTGSVSAPEMSSEGGDSTATPAAGTRVRYFGDYELLGNLGEGGMGVVFEARQRSLNRIVALKMIRAGRFAGDDDLRRFRNEAEAVAKLDHPHIVPVYEVGDHAGHSYFSMKRIEGTSLASRLGELRDRPREAARLVATVARALHHAHQRGVLHRDLKPSNVLLDATGEPHLTDFGLAKRLEGPGAAETTRTGAILGTPAYMAPEQASGQRGEVTTATDVFGLGALLYALLSGHAPFRGESVADTLVQVRECSPEPIRKSNPKVPRDLETICVRCLDREPRRRYASADAVAEELGRWLNGEPITARPAGKLERGWMWCRRNPLVAALTAAVAAVLILSTAVSTVFAVRESNRARAERTERIRAENAEEDTRKARDDIEGTFAQSLIQPLDAEGDATEVGYWVVGSNWKGQLEVEALWELAGHAAESLGFRLLDEATRAPMTTRQLCARSEPALIAAVGLDQKKREQAIALLMKRLAEPGLPLAQKADIALTALELTDRPGPETAACEEALATAIKAVVPVHLLVAWKKHLSRDVERLEPNTTARLLLLALHKETNAAELGNLALALAEVASRLAPAMAASLCGEALRVLTDALVRETSDAGRQALAGGFRALAGRLPRGAAIRSLTEALGRAADSGARQRLAAGLGAVIPAIPADDFTENLPTVARSLAQALSREPDERARRDLASGLAKLVKSWRKPEASDLRHVVQSLATALRAEKDPRRRGRLAWALAPLAECLGPEASARICLSEAESLSSDSTSTDIDPDAVWIRILVAMVIRWPTAIAAEAARLIARAASNAPNGSQNVLLALNGLDEGDAARTARVLLMALARETDTNTRWWLAAGLSIVAEKMDREDAAQLCGPVVVDMAKPVAAESGFNNIEYGNHLINGFVVVASRQTPAVASRSARVLADALKGKSGVSFRMALAKGLETLARRMEPVEAERICGEAARVLADALHQRPIDPDAAQGLAVLAGRMNRGEAERISADAARNLSDVLSRDTDESLHYRVYPNYLFPVETLASLAAGMEPVEAVRMLANVLEREIDDEARMTLAQGLSVTTARMEPGAAARVCDNTIRALLRARAARPRDARDRRGFDFSVAELLPRLEARDASAQAAILAAVMCSEGDLSCGIGVNRTPTELSRVLTDTSRMESERRAARTAVMTTGLGAAPTAGVSLAAEPWPCRLTSQELVDLLKIPTCNGKARQVVLERLGNIHGRRFANHWEFVRFAHENRLSLDLTTAPRRPDPAALGAEEAPPR